MDSNMNNRHYWSLALILIFTALPAVSCGRADNPAVPANPQVSDRQIDESEDTRGHQLWGFWNCYIPATQDTIEFMPVRTGMHHMNARRFLEDTQCKNCLEMVSINKDFINMVITAEIKITHPFTGYDKYTGFDVRGIVISNGSLYFPALNARIPSAKMGDFTILNPDGWTRMWNTIEFPPGSGKFKILEYSQGKMAAAGSFTSTVNPYIEFTQDPRSCFPAGASITRTYQMTLKPGGAIFGYAIDASWEKPLVDPPVDLMTDFSENANAAEVYVVNTNLDAPLKDFVGDTAYLSLEMIDRQASGLPMTAYLESPELWPGVIEPEIWGIGPGEPLWNDVFTSFDLTNELGATEGEYPALIKIVDSLPDPWLGDVNHRYKLIYIPVIHYEPPNIDGKVVYTAPGPPDPGGSGALNVWLLELETMQKTMLTNFQGIGVMLEEPRINPKGTHMLLTIGTTPMDSRVDVYQIGGSNWTVTPSGTFDGTADFAPDGERIVVASGTGWGNTPDLYTMKYNGSERTFLATAPGSVRCPRWSPDGKRIAMIVSIMSTPPEYSIYVYNISTKKFTKIESGEYMLDFPAWNPAKPGGQDIIAYQSSENDPWGFMSDIWAINPDTLEKQILFDSGWGERHPSWSPDGKMVMYAQEMGGDLWVYQISNGEMHQITFSDDYEDNPCWSWGW